MIHCVVYSDLLTDKYSSTYATQQIHPLQSLYDLASYIINYIKANCKYITAHGCGYISIVAMYAVCEMTSKTWTT